eukprot:TRINITY_DN6936_c0_g1_i2.p1 TRINITY_DN6936_c0_g1~~TRINITY_DN6936_c0_g1_i2.p1  ORF type:complete len:216 (-),score=45.91 TRINITY_DN6936_c0_g1_i2:107-754(-)
MFYCFIGFFFFFFKQKTAYEMLRSLVGSEMCIRDRSEAGLEQALSQRFAIVNIWTPLTTVRNDPLGMVEWRTTAPLDVQTRSDRVRAERFPVRETYRGLHNEAHRWVYFPEMQPSECLLLKTFDSCRASGMAQFALHGAFKLAEQEEELPPRESVEVRCLVFWGELEPGFGNGFVPPRGQSGQPGGTDVVQSTRWLARNENEWSVGEHCPIDERG